MRARPVVSVRRTIVERVPGGAGTSTVSSPNTST
jgi:hypothetical protein